MIQPALTRPDGAWEAENFDPQAELLEWDALDLRQLRSARVVPR